MLITTGILLGVVLLVMVGEQAQEMQLAHWITTTQLNWLVIPAWMGMWFAIFPTVETLVAQLLAAMLVVGSYYAARRIRTQSSDAAESTSASNDDIKIIEHLETDADERRLTRNIPTFLQAASSPPI
jgi:type III secretory pathway component EscV